MVAGTVPGMKDGSLPWPEEYRSLEAPLRNAWSIEDLYLHRVLSGKSGALVYAVDATAAEFTGQAILKLAELGDLREDEADEATRHLQAVDANPEYAARHLPTIVHIFEHEQRQAVLSTIAARGLQYSDPWAHCPFDIQLSSGTELAAGLLESWNSGYRIADGIATPQDLLSAWLGYRLDPGKGGRIHSFLADECNLDPDEPTLLFEGHWYPNPLSFATTAQRDELALRAVIGNLHGDLHGYNVLVDSRDAPQVAYYVIDLAFYQPDAFLLFDHAYLEMSHLLRTRDSASLDQWLGLVDALTRDAQPAGDDLGIVQLLTAMRDEVSAWIERHEPNRLSYIESQFMLARVAVGLTFSHRRMPLASRLKCFLYAAANLKRYLKFHNVDWPKHGQVLVVSQDEGVPTDLAGRDTRQGLASPGGEGTESRDPVPQRNIQFATTEDGAGVAFWAMGSGTPLVINHNFSHSHLEAEWTVPSLASFYTSLAERYRVIRFDPRGCGMSQNLSPEWEPTPDGGRIGRSTREMCLDISAVAEACGVERFALLAVSSMGPVGIEYAATHPDEVIGLILCDAVAKIEGSFMEPFMRGQFALAQTEKEAGVELPVTIWDQVVPAGELAQWADLIRRAGPQEQDDVSHSPTQWQWDAEPFLGEVQAPTLVLTVQNYQLVDLLPDARRLAARIPNAQLVSLDGTWLPYAADRQAVLEAIDGLLGVAGGPSRI